MKITKKAVLAIMCLSLAVFAPGKAHAANKVQIPDGAFGNDPQEVAELFRDNLKKFGCFEEVVFAVRMVAGRDERNYQVFQKVLKKL